MSFERVAQGCYLEGMYADCDVRWYSDALMGGVFRRSADGRVAGWLSDRRWIGGVLLNADGKLLCSGPGGIAWLDPATGATGMLVEAVDGERIGAGALPFPRIW